MTLIDLIFITCCFNYYFPVGKTMCTWCDERIKYGGGGKTVLRSHAKTKKHQRSRNTVKNSQNLPAVFQRVAERVDDGSLDKDHDKSCNLPYGAAPNTHGHSCSSDPASKTVLLAAILLCWLITVETLCNEIAGDREISYEFIGLQFNFCIRF